MPKTLEAGSELDARVAEEVMGLHLHTIADGSHRGVYWTRAPGPYAPCLWRADYRDPDEVPSDCARLTFCPSTDWAAAGEVLAWLRQQDADTQQRFYDGLAAQWRQWAAAQETEGMTEDKWCEIHLLTGTSRWFILYADIPLAISLAALEAVKQNQDGP